MADIAPSTKEFVREIINEEAVIERVAPARTAKLLTDDLIEKICDLAYRWDTSARFAADCCGVPLKQWDGWEQRSKKAHSGQYAKLRDALHAVHLKKCLRHKRQEMMKRPNASLQELERIGRRLDPSMYEGQAPEAGTGATVINMPVMMLGVVEDFRSCGQLQKASNIYGELSANWSKPQLEAENSEK